MHLFMLHEARELTQHVAINFINVLIKSTIRHTHTQQQNCNIIHLMMKMCLITVEYLYIIKYI